MDFVRLQKGAISVVDQTLLPEKMNWLKLTSLEDVAEAIRSMKVRGAPLIGVVGAFGLALLAERSKAGSKRELKRELRRAVELLSSIRPTGRNLSWALQSVLKEAEAARSLEAARSAVSRAARELLREDLQVNRAIGKVGSKLILDGDAILTHCNTGSLATTGYGTALGIIRTAWEEGKRISVYATETRPLLQGARLTTFELKRLQIPVKLIVDSAVGHVLANRLVSKVFVGADRVLLSGHVFNKIGTYPIAVLAKNNNVPFYVAAPISTIDPCNRPEDVVVEYRDQSEVLLFEGGRIAPLDVEALNPAFDLTPPRYISGIVTERVIAHPPFKRSIKRILAESRESSSS